MCRPPRLCGVRWRAAGRSRAPGLPRAVWVVAGGSFVNRLGGFVVPFLVLYLTHRGYSSAEAGLAVSAYAGGKIAAGPTGGLLTDRLGGRLVTSASMTASAATTLALAMAAGLGPILATAAVTGLCSELYRPATSAIIAGSVPDPAKRATAFGVYQAAASGGTAIGLTLGGLLAEHSFIALFAADAGTSLAWALLAARALPRTWPVLPESRYAPTGAVLRDGRMARLVAATILVYLTLFQAQATLPLWVREQDLSAGTYGMLLGLNAALVMIGQIPAARLTRRRAPVPVIAVTSIVVGVGFALLAAAHTALALAFAVTVWSLGELAQWPVAASYAMSLAPPGQAGRYAGARSAGYALALLLAPLAGDALYARDPTILWAACAAAGTLAAAIIALPRAAASRRGRAARQAAAGSDERSELAHGASGKRADRRSVTAPASLYLPEQAASGDPRDPNRQAGPTRPGGRRGETWLTT